jgi:hypothetical protein
VDRGLSPLGSREVEMQRQPIDIDRDKMVAIARKIATPDQPKALADAGNRQVSRQRGGTKP